MTHGQGWVFFPLIDYAPIACLLFENHTDISASWAMISDFEVRDTERMFPSTH